MGRLRWTPARGAGLLAQGALSHTAEQAGIRLFVCFMLSLSLTTRDWRGWVVGGAAAAAIEAEKEAADAARVADAAAQAVLSGKSN
eukprot:1175807-Prorocentrum_minimum.AAC.1